MATTNTQISIVYRKKAKGMVRNGWNGFAFINELMTSAIAATLDAVTPVVWSLCIDVSNPAQVRLTVIDHQKRCSPGSVAILRVDSLVSLRDSLYADIHPSRDCVIM